MSTFSPYHRNGHSDKQPRYNIQLLLDYGWDDTGLTTPEGRTIFALDNGALLIRHEGGCLINIGNNGITLFYPPEHDFQEMTEKVIGLMGKQVEEAELPDNYGLEGGL